MKDKICSWWEERRYIVLAFFMPFIILMLAYIAMWITPFGDLSLIVSDMSAQYIDMFSAYRDFMHGNRSLFYSWSQIQGSNMFALMTSYILSPFNIITALFPEEYIVDSITFITMIKAGFAGASCSWYLKKSFNRNDISIATFACCYALMGYNIIFALNILWLDLVILLPLVIWGVDLILKDTKKFMFFTISLIAIFCLNYYLAYMIGMFSFAYFMYKYFCIYEINSINLFAKKIGAFFGSAVLAALCSAWILLPHYYSLGLGTRAGFLESDQLKLSLQYDFLTIFTKLFIGSYDTVAYGGVANIYCGLIVTILLLLYFMNKKIRFREKILAFVMFIFFWFSCVISVLYLGWHLFALPHFFEARFSFVICFFMIIIGYTSYTKLDGIFTKNINHVFLAIAAVVILIDRMNYKYITDIVTIATIFFLFLYYLFFIVMQNKEEAKKYFTLIFTALLCTELSLNANITILNMDEMLNYPNKYDYYEERDKIKEDIEQILSNDSNFYRIEKDFSRSGNDGINIGYPCIEMFTSSYNQSTKDQMSHLGVKVGHNWVSYDGFTPITDAMFNIKYLILKDNDMLFYTFAHKKPERTIYQNPYALSIGYMVAEDLNGYYDMDKNEIQNPFLYQNKLLAHMIGESEGNYFKPISINRVQLENMASIDKNYTPSDSTDTIPLKQYYKKDNNQEGYLEYEVEAKQGPLYLYLPTKFAVPMYIQIQDKEKKAYFELDSNHIVYLGTYKEGEKVKVKVMHGGKDIVLQDTLFYYLDVSLFSQAIDRLNKNVVQVEDYSDNTIKGTVTVDDKHILFTSIPYDEGWNLKVNGMEYKPIKVLNGFIGVELSNPGTYHLEFTFVPKGLKTGVMLSIVGIISLLTISIFIKVKYKSKLDENELIMN